MADPDTTIDWSYSNAQLYESCPRSLFFHYWQRQRTGNRKKSDGEGDTIFHRGPDSAGAIIGSAIHKALEEHIQSWAQNEQTGLQQTQSVAKSYIRDTVSREQGSQSLDSSALSETADAHLETFFRTVWPSLQSQRYILHEETRSFKIGGTTVWVRPDLCVRESNTESDTDTFVIYDWKSRRPSAFEDASLQLDVYALWAYKKFEPDLDRISPRLVFTGNGHVKRQKLSPQDLERLEMRITREFMEWNPPDHSSSFPAEPMSEKCNKCPYISSCSEGQQEVGNLKES